MRRPYTLVVAASICISGFAVADPLLRPAQLAPDLDSFPRLAGDSPEDLRINAQLAEADQNALERATECRARPGSWWDRNVEVAFDGPRYLSLDALNDLYCEGAAHPTSFLETPTYDLATGEHLDWRQVLPADLLATQPQRFDLAVVKGSPRLVALYLQANPTAPPECRQEIAASVSYFRLWISGRDGGVVLVPDDLAYANLACADPVVLTLPMLVRIGVSPGLIDALVSDGLDGP